MTIKDITSYIEELAPLAYAEDFDNVGLLVGNYQTKVTGILVTLDTLEKTIDEAIANNCNLIVSFHPIIFSGLKKLNGNNYVERVVLKAIQNNIAIYATHTALDNSNNGVSAKMGEVLGLQNLKVLLPKKGLIKKLTTYVPPTEANHLRKALFEAGAGTIGNYSNCSFNVEGKGSYKGNDNSNPVKGEKGVYVFEEESCISVTFNSYLEQKILKALFNVHPYEEVAYEIITLNNYNQNVGMGMIGELPEEMKEADFLPFVKKTMNTNCIRHSQLLQKPIKKVALLGGSGSFAIDNAIRSGADAYISADFKYHEFFKAEKKILLADIGHYESEQFTKNLLVEYLTKKFTNFAIILSEESTNPIYYI
ncbi:Nif3-like dinuclear metal center hexameric protein [Tenacibaculum maritimum]|uniref:GTP cyclohydrolase 1 type 2 homolog n=2 Tax=Tenacibaculum maritimum TaxID=107401 RepID=A0A2H1E7W8_9FLAO|nr:Nif3-like dinuclear metal center hexameric protein [Tenacibaculum maritimum]MCD9562983.1 Nif3-like dinuclear metal center hexameric protein [Tenacibaculum maritimum]MCD9565328.1 Nif3-like dinuclear metal center hexameric protein [Tenacibaculum maritimum]MCD9578879.1 Nif3-like dinuclear metal center hexameric protein [Tenacibaculum maritimum]MCD9597746.1 Nif3-like dinuclear metal center hexameric protein [Tenacibaculum maritimum]MCD9613284.1 Nif3-like dinuclear metal center hexameric protein